MSKIYPKSEIDSIINQFNILSNNFNSIVLEIKDSLFLLKQEIFYIEINCYTLNLIDISTNITDKRIVKTINNISIKYENYQTIIDLLYDLSVILNNSQTNEQNTSFFTDFPYSSNYISPNNYDGYLDYSFDNEIKINFKDQIAKIMTIPNIEFRGFYDNVDFNESNFWFVYTFNNFQNIVKVSLFLSSKYNKFFTIIFFTNTPFKNNLLQQIEEIFSKQKNLVPNNEHTMYFIVNAINEAIYALGETCFNIYFEKLAELVKKNYQYKRELTEIFKMPKENSNSNAPKGVGYKRDENNNETTKNHNDYARIANDRKNEIIKCLKIFFANVTAQEFNNKEVLKIIKYISSLYSDTPEIVELITAESKKIIDVIPPMILDDFQKEFNKYRIVEIEKPSNFRAKTELHSLSALQTKRIVKEIEILKKALPISKYASIYTAICKNENNAIRFLVTGPFGTPYENGLYIFDLTVTPLFPKEPPSFLIVNTGGDRCNPNLYAEGRVCLSILGTHHGTGSEIWDAEKSTFYQILMAVQTQILVEHPYFNEPGWDTDRGSPASLVKANEYNKNVVFMTLKNSLLDMFKNCHLKYPEFKDVIRNHIIYHKESIRKTLEYWETFTTKKQEFINNKNELFNLLATH